MMGIRESELAARLVEDTMVLALNASCPCAIACICIACVDLEVISYHISLIGRQICMEACGGLRIHSFETYLIQSVWPVKTLPRYDSLAVVSLLQA